MQRKTASCQSRRAFLRRLSGIAVAPPMISSAALGGGNRLPAGERIATGFIGLGWKGFEGCWGSLLQSFIAYELNRPLRWDPDREVFVDDLEADRFLDRARREPWSV